MAVPTQVTPAAGGGGLSDTAGSAPNYTQISPQAPTTGIAANDLLILHCAARATTTVDSFTIGAGFTLGGTVGLATPQAANWYYRLCTGVENAATYTVNGTYTGTAPEIVARIYLFKGNATASITEGGGTASATSATATYTAIATGASIERLCIYLVSYGNGSSVGAVTGETGGDFTDQIGEFRGTNLSIQCERAPITGSGGISGGSLSITSAPWRTHSFAIKSRVSNIPNRTLQTRQAIKRASFY